MTDTKSTARLQVKLIEGETLDEIEAGINAFLASGDDFTSADYTISRTSRGAPYTALISYYRVLPKVEAAQ